MTAIAVFMDSVGPVHGLVVSELRSLGYEPHIYYIPENRFIQPEPTAIPAWAQSPSDTGAKNWLINYLTENSVESIVAIGFRSVATAETMAGFFRTMGIMLPGELDIGRKRRRQIQHFQTLSRSLDAFIFFNEWEMTKACSLGSEAPHYLWNIGNTSSQVTFGTSDDTKIAVYYDGSRYAQQPDLDELRLSALDTKGLEYELLPSNSLFWYTDLALNRYLKNTLMLRTKSYSHAIFCHDDPHSQIGIATLNGGERTVFSVPGVAPELLRRTREHLEIATPTRIVSLIEKEIREERQVFDQQVTYIPGLSLEQIIQKVPQEDATRFIEDFGEIDSLAVFMTVSPVENSSAGARPQRIRNFYLAMARDVPTLQLSLTDPLLSRRIRLLEHMNRNGIKIHYIYGENSTNPIGSYDLVLKTKRTIDYLAREQGTKSLWFVRDVHWLDDRLKGDGIEIDDTKIRYGIFELDHFKDSFGGFVAPSPISGEMYADMASPYLTVEFLEQGLPPGIHYANVVPASVDAKVSDKVTFVYTGGISKLYSMDAYLDALEKLLTNNPESCFADFIVRPAEQHLLDKALVDRNLAGLDAIRVLNGDFSAYKSRTELNLGILLLESGYGSNAFAFKSVSYIERAMPFLAYRDAPAYSYFSSYGAALPVENEENVYDSLLNVINDPMMSVDWEQVWNHETWDKRWAQVKELARCGAREFS